MEIKIERVEPATPISTATPTFATMPDTPVTLSMLTDVGIVTGIQMAATTFGFGGRHLEFR